MPLEQHFENVRSANLPTNEFIREHSIVLGGESLIVGLAPEQAEALQKYATDRAIPDIRLADPPLSENEQRALNKSDRPGGRISIQKGSVALSLGHGVHSHKQLFKALGILE